MSRSKTKRKKGVRGHAKGAEFERQVCKSLSLWISGEERDDLFWRTAMSGGRATIGRKAGKMRSAQSGDISAIHPLGAPLVAQFIVECKFYASLDLESFVFRSCGKLWGFWERLKKDSASESKSPMLIAKQNRTDTLVLLRPEAFKSLFSIIPPRVRVPGGIEIVTFNRFLRMAKLRT